MLAAGFADKIEIQLSYAIGVSLPISIMIDTFGTGKLSNNRIIEAIRKEFDLSPNSIIQMLKLRQPIYKQTLAYGYFSRTDIDLPWERLDKVDIFKKILIDNEEVNF